MFEDQLPLPTKRPRRLRGSASLRDSVAESQVTPQNLWLPVFVREGLTDARPISSMPGVVQHSMESLCKVAESAAAAKLGGLMLFGIPEHKDSIGSAALNPQGILNRALAELRPVVGDDLPLIGDLCLDEFTDHGHCGVLDAAGNVANDDTLKVYAQMALAQAEAGAHLLGLSGMMDGQVAAVRHALDGAGHAEVGIVAYSAKYASGFYGPFREAVNSSLVGDRRTYQIDPRNGLEGVRESVLDEGEGADVVMVKPAMSYLDVVAAVRASVRVPVAAYQVSGEYAMIQAAAERGWLNREQVILESLLSIRRAGANLVATYFALDAAPLL
jgi:porphobilinogen synthase